MDGKVFSLAFNALPSMPERNGTWLDVSYVGTALTSARTRTTRENGRVARALTRAPAREDDEVADVVPRTRARAAIECGASATDIVCERMSAQKPGRVANARVRL